MIAITKASNLYSIDRLQFPWLTAAIGKAVSWLNYSCNIKDFFIAGSETAASTLSFAILHMVHRPDIQARIQKEIDEHVGRVKSREAL